MLGARISKGIWPVIAGLCLVLPGFASADPAKNVIICFGDGMGWEQIRAGEYYMGRPAVFKSFPYTSVVQTACADTNVNPVTDSAAAGTAIFTGHRVNYNCVGLALPPDTGYSAGAEYETIAEFMKARGRSIGNLTTCFINDATPATFDAHELTRANYSQILDDYFVQTRPNLLWGGGSENYTMTPQRALDAGYTVVTNRAALLALPTNSANVYSCGLFGPSTMGYEYDGMTNLPHLTDMAMKAINILDKDPDGFCLMVEGGEIDLGCHIGDLNRMTGEVVEFDRMVSNVMAWANSRTDTLVIVCADHECGGLTNLVNNGPNHYPGGNFTASYHTAAPVPVFAWGFGASNIVGAQHLTNIYHTLTGGLAPPAASNAPVVTNWTAYNDLSWQAGQPTANITLYGTNGASGSLVDFLTGQTVPATVSISGVNVSETANLIPLPPDSDAEATFSGKVSEDGYRFWTAGTVDLTFSELSPSNLYTFALYGDRGSAAYTYRWTDVTIADVTSFTNNSSSGSTIFTTTLANDTTRILAANTNGQLYRFSNINPGPDGDVVFHMTALGSSSTSAYINAFMFGITSNGTSNGGSGTTTNLSELLPAASTWRYLDTGTNAGTSWRTSGFNDSTWSSGAAPLGYGGLASVVSNIVSTFISYGSDPTNKYVTSYFRKSIVVDDPSRLTNVILNAQFDDGAIIYVNNTAVWTYNTTNAGVDYSTLALVGIGSGNETNILTQAISQGVFITGTNWITAEVHQITRGSSDILFNLWATNLLGGTNAGYTADADTDGMDDFWEQTYFGGSSATNGAAGQDADGDGFDNFSEYRAGTDPTAASSKLEMSGVVTTNTPGVFSLQWSSVYGKHYSIQSASNLTATWLVDDTNIIAIGPTLTHTVTANVSRAFWRVKLE